MGKQPDWYNKVRRAGPSVNLMPRGREHTVTPKMQPGWMTHGSMLHQKAPRHIRRKRRRGQGLYDRLGTVFELVQLLAEFDLLLEERLDAGEPDDD